MTFAWPSFPSLQNHVVTEKKEPAKVKGPAKPRAAAVTKKGDLEVRYCAYHDGDWNAADGKMLAMKRTARWMCGQCLRVREERAAAASA